MKQRQSKTKTIPLEEIPAPPDGGWGWVVCFASFLCNMILDGIAYSFGILLGPLVIYFDSNRSTVSWVGSLLCGVYMASGPIVGGLVNKFGCRHSVWKLSQKVSKSKKRLIKNSCQIVWKSSVLFRMSINFDEFFLDFSYVIFYWKLIYIFFWNVNKLWRIFPKFFIRNLLLKTNLHFRGKIQIFEN